MGSAVRDVLRHHSGALGRIRTCGTRFRKPTIGRVWRGGDLHICAYLGVLSHSSTRSAHGQRPTWRTDTRARRRLETRTFGKRILFTNRDAWTTADVVAAYRRTGDGWQTRINADLRKARKLKAG